MQANAIRSIARSLSKVEAEVHEQQATPAKARLFARDEREDGAEIRHGSARFDALQSVIN